MGRPLYLGEEMSDWALANEQLIMYWIYAIIAYAILIRAEIWALDRWDGPI